MTSFSIIIPVRNAEKTIRQCLEAILASSFRDFEIIVVDDASTDKTVKIAQEFSCKIICLGEQRGPAYARMFGLKESSSDMVVFIDADILVAHDTLLELTNIFSTAKDTVAIVGMLSKDHPNKNFFSQYKNLYMHYIFSRCPTQIDFLYGSFYAIKKVYCNFIPANRVYGEDTELGLCLAQQGYKIVLDKKLEVVHLKNYSFFSFVKNDFLVPFYWARLFLRENGWKNVLQKKRFCHSQKEQLLSVLLAPVIILSIYFYPLAAMCMLVIQFFLNIRFFMFLFLEKGIVFALCAIPVTLFDFLVMAIGIMTGFIIFQK
ncbi:MAG: glycosyltransferase family 2 protein [Candidatus Omnitrophota bacterium]|nr:glycosyltransferase family 2 protein [Candidatus Omnitrophota bacterium]